MWLFHGKNAIPKKRKELADEFASSKRGEEVWMPSNAWIIIASK